MLTQIVHGEGMSEDVWQLLFSTSASLTGAERARLNSNRYKVFIAKKALGNNFSLNRTLYQTDCFELLAAGAVQGVFLEKLNRGVSKPGRFPLFSGMGLIVCRTLSGMFPMGALQKAKKEGKDKSGKSPKKRGK